MTTTTVDPSVVDDAATALAALADLDFDTDQPCELSFGCPVEAPERAQWFAVTVQLPCAHEHKTDWLICGRCLESILRHRQHAGCSAQVRCSVRNYAAATPLATWVVSYRPIEQPVWAKGDA